MIQNGASLSLALRKSTTPDPAWVEASAAPEALEVKAALAVKGPPEAKPVKAVRVVVRDAAVSVRLTQMQKSCRRP